MAPHSVLRMISTFNISNTKKDCGFDSRILVQIIWYIQIFPLSAPLSKKKKAFQNKHQKNIHSEKNAQNILLYSAMGQVSQVSTL